jgi:hypothetical protein
LKISAARVAGIVYRHGFKRPFTVAQEPRPIPPPVPPQPPPFPGPTPHPHPIPPAQPQSV